MKRNDLGNYLYCSSLNRRVLFLAQVASESAAVIFDLQTLGRSPALDACLASVLGGAGSGSGSGGGISGSGDGDGSGGGASGSRSGISRSCDLGTGRSGSEAAGSSGATHGGGETLNPKPPPQHQPRDPAAATSPAGSAAAPQQRRHPTAAAAASATEPAPATAEQPPLKCGVGVSEDLRRLARTHPHMRAFRHIPRVLDLRHPWLALQSEKVQLRPPAPVPTLASLLRMEEALHASNSKQFSCGTQLWRGSHLQAATRNALPSLAAKALMAVAKPVTLHLLSRTGRQPKKGRCCGGPVRHVAALIGKAAGQEPAGALVSAWNINEDQEVTSASFTS